MSKQHKKDEKKMLGLLIGGALGLGALTLFLATRKEKAPLNTIGGTITRIGEILGAHHIDEPAAVRHVENSIHHCEGTIGQAAEWIALGINLWKKFKK